MGAPPYSVMLLVLRATLSLKLGYYDSLEGWVCSSVVEPSIQEVLPPTLTHKHCKTTKITLLLGNTEFLAVPGGARAARDQLVNARLKEREGE